MSKRKREEPTCQAREVVSVHPSIPQQRTREARRAAVRARLAGVR